MEISGNDLPNRPEVLDADVARALRLYFDDELSLREIAVELGISPNDGRELVTTGMQHLDRALAGDDDGTLGVS
jgi:DNA-directed RNA polymerase specialized sigma24 family protein